MSGMQIRVLFADDQLPSSDPAENEQTRNEIRRERPDIQDLDRAFDDDFRWFTGLLDYLERTKGLRVVPVRSFSEASARIEDKADYDVAVVDMSWWGDARLPPGRRARHNRGLDLLKRLAELQAAGAAVSTIALSQNFKDDFELMSTVLDLDALPMPKSYDVHGLGYRALYAAIDHLAKQQRRRVGEREPGGARRRNGDGPVQLFVSHAHKDEDLARMLVEAIALGMQAPQGSIRCTSLSGYQLALGAMARDALRDELSGAKGIVALLTPYSLSSEWCQFELGAAWVLATATMPLRAGGLRDADIPGAFRGAVGGTAEQPAVLRQLLDQLQTLLGWPVGNVPAAHAKLDELAKLATRKTYLEDDIAVERARSFAAKLAGLGNRQTAIIHYIAQGVADRSHVPQEELFDSFRDTPTNLYYRLEQLRYLGFLNRQALGKDNGKERFGWTLSKAYGTEIGVVIP
jgi:hypothetical protein